MAFFFAEQLMIIERLETRTHAHYRTRANSEIVIYSYPRSLLCDKHVGARG